jgi:CheY-like chemotaxis protein
MSDSRRLQDDQTADDYPVCTQCVKPVGAGQNAAFRGGKAVHVYCEAQADSIPAPTTREADRIVLYIDDNASNVRLVNLLLEQRPGVRFISADTGRLGLDLARQHCPTVILLDLRLPDIAGVQVLSAIRHDPVIARTPVIVLSAENDPSVGAQVLAAGAQGYSRSRSTWWNSSPHSMRWHRQGRRPHPSVPSQRFVRKTERCSRGSRRPSWSTRTVWARRW